MVVVFANDASPENVADGVVVVDEFVVYAVG